MSHDKNDDADSFLLGIDRTESNTERNGRHYAEGEARFATVAALAELAKTVTALISSQATTNQTLSALTRSFEGATKDVGTLKIWMEGTLEPNGERTLGVLDHISTFKKWKNWVIGLLSAILLSQCTNTVIGLLNHQAVTK